MAGGTLREVRALAGHPTDYVDPAGAIQSVAYQLISRYAAAGGDLGNFEIRTFSAGRGCTISIEGPQA